MGAARQAPRLTTPTTSPPLAQTPLTLRVTQLARPHRHHQPLRWCDPQRPALPLPHSRQGPPCRGRRSRSYRLSSCRLHLPPRWPRSSPRPCSQPASQPFRPCTRLMTKGVQKVIGLQDQGWLSASKRSCWGSLKLL